jgi:hypothetical protein
MVDVRAPSIDAALAAETKAVVIAVGFVPAEQGSWIGEPFEDVFPADLALEVAFRKTFVLDSLVLGVVLEVIHIRLEEREAWNHAAESGVVHVHNQTKQ